MEKPQFPDNLDRLFEALANHHRRAMVYALGLQPYAISQLAQQRGLSLTAIHRHITILENAGLVIHRKIGRTHFLSLNKEALRTLQQWLMQFQAYWGDNVETLENYAHFLESKKRERR